MTFVIPQKKSGKNFKLPFRLLLFILLFSTAFDIDFDILRLTLTLSLSLLSLSCIQITHQRHKTDNGYCAERHDNRGDQR